MFLVNSDLIINNVSNMNKILVGSRAFFTGIEGFTPHDYDYVIFETARTKISTIIYKGCDVFAVPKLSKEELITLFLNSDHRNSLCFFLIPEIIEKIGFCIEDLNKVKDLVDRLDDKHKYEKIIFDAYLENGKMELTDEQRLKAFECYKKARENE